MATKVTLHCMEWGFGNTDVVRAAESGQDKKQYFYPIQRVFSNLCRFNEEWYVVDTFQMVFVAPEVDGEKFIKIDCNLRTTGTVETKYYATPRLWTNVQISIFGNIGGEEEIAKFLWW